MDWNDSAAMLATKSSAGATPKVNLRILLHAGDKVHKCRLLNPGQMSPDVKNWDISGPIKRTNVLQKSKKKNRRIS